MRDDAADGAQWAGRVAGVAWTERHAAAVGAPGQEGRRRAARLARLGLRQLRPVRDAAASQRLQLDPADRRRTDVRPCPATPR